MKFTAEIDIMPLKELLDPQGKAVMAGFKHLQLDGIRDARIGKHITLHLEADSQSSAREMVETACKKLLANPVMEYFTFSIQADSE